MQAIYLRYRQPVHPTCPTRHPPTPAAACCRQPARGRRSVVLSIYSIRTCTAIISPSVEPGQTPTTESTDHQSTRPFSGNVHRRVARRVYPPRPHEASPASQPEIAHDCTLELDNPRPLLLLVASSLPPFPQVLRTPRITVRVSNGLPFRPIEPSKRYMVLG